jgi:hypothetical protein
MATLAKSIVKLREQVNARHPRRSKASDGTWPSAAHRRQSPNSDHNHGNAVDFTHDPKNGLNSEKLADHLRQSRDPRLRYVISNRKIASAKTGWRWARYGGANAHDKHVHVSVNRAADSDRPWSLPPAVSVPRAGIADFEAEPLEQVTSPVETDEGADEVADEMSENEGEGRKCRASRSTKSPILQRLIRPRSSRKVLSARWRSGPFSSAGRCKLIRLQPALRFLHRLSNRALRRHFHNTAKLIQRQFRVR